MIINLISSNEKNQNRFITQLANKIKDKVKGEAGIFVRDLQWSTKYEIDSSFPKMYSPKKKADIIEKLINAKRNINPRWLSESLYYGSIENYKLTIKDTPKLKEDPILNKIKVLAPIFIVTGFDSLCDLEFLKEKGYLTIRLFNKDENDKYILEMYDYDQMCDIISKKYDFKPKTDDVLITSAESIGYYHNKITDKFTYSRINTFQQELNEHKLYDINIVYGQDNMEDIFDEVIKNILIKYKRILSDRKNYIMALDKIL